MNQRILLHIGFWIIYVLYSGYLSVPLSGTTFADLSLPDRFRLGYLAESILLVLKVPAVYFVLYKLLPQNFTKKNVWRFIGQAFLVAALLTYLSTKLWHLFVYPTIYGIDPPGQAASAWLGISRWIYNSIDILMLLGIASTIKLFRIKMQNEKREKILMEEKLSSELKFLRSQTNPHFLFNTLNNLYHLARKNSQSTPDAILKLSGLMRFMLYECLSTTIPISKEVALITDYIELEKLRYGDRLKIIFDTNIDIASQAISPLLLLPFVENAFKHGASESRGESEIEINLKTKKGILDFFIKNTKDHDHAFNQNGIGLNNVQKQLNLIYPSHSLKIQNKDIEFIVFLTIDLNEANLI